MPEFVDFLHAQGGEMYIAVCRAMGWKPGVSKLRWSVKNVPRY